MDKIYSRKRIKIFKLKEKYIKGKNAKKIFSIFIIILSTVITFYSILKVIGPVFEGLCIEKTRELGTSIINNSSNKVLDSINYKDIVKIEKDGSNRVLKTDVVVINKIASNIALEIQNEFKKLEKEIIKIPIGALTGSKYLSGSGPNISIRVISAGNVITEIKNEFKAQGINQTAYRIYLEVTCNVSVVTQYKEIQDKIINQVLLVETVIVGDVPSSYYNLEGINQSEAIDIIE